MSASAKKEPQELAAPRQTQHPWVQCIVSAIRHLNAHRHTHTHTTDAAIKATTPFPLKPIKPLSQEGTVSSIPNMNKTSCYSFLDKHPSKCPQTRGGTTASFGFPPAICDGDGLPRRSLGPAKWSYAVQSACFPEGAGWNL